MYCYIINYYYNNIFYKRDILQLFKHKKKEYNIVFDIESNEYINIDDMKVVKTKYFMENDLPEYYKCNYNENIILYVNEYNIVLCTNDELDKSDIKKVLDPDYPLIIFFY